MSDVDRQLLLALKKERDRQRELLERAEQIIRETYPQSAWLMDYKGFLKRFPKKT